MPSNDPARNSIRPDSPTIPDDGRDLSSSGSSEQNRSRTPSPPFTFSDLGARLDAQSAFVAEASRAATAVIAVNDDQPSGTLQFTDPRRPSFRRGTSSHLPPSTDHLHITVPGYNGDLTGYINIHSRLPDKFCAYVVGASPDQTDTHMTTTEPETWHEVSVYASARPSDVALGGNGAPRPRVPDLGVREPRSVQVTFLGTEEQIQMASQLLLQSELAERAPRSESPARAF